MIKLFNHYFHRGTLFKIGLDFLILALTLIGAAIYSDLRHPDFLQTVVWLFIPAATGLFLINKSLGIYVTGQPRTLGQSVARAILGVLLTQPLILLITSAMGNQEIFRAFLGCGFALIMCVSIYTSHSKLLGMFRQRVLVVGMGQRAKAVGNTLKKMNPQLELVGYYAGKQEVETEVSAWGILSPDETLTEIVKRQKVDEIVVALAERRGGSLPLQDLLTCKIDGVKVIDVATHFEKLLGQIRLDAVSPGWLVFGDGFEQGFFRSAVKRIFDIIFASLLIFITWPVMLITGILVLVESGGPILYLQERVGLNGKSFNVVKFRSMRTDAEKDGKPRWATAGDDRVTRVGRVIRKLRIDELPQLYSVLVGDMSLVGPRPERPYFVNQLSKDIPYFNVRQTVKPGVTGWAQVRYQYGSTFEDAMEKLQYDLYYIKNNSLLLDLVVLFETIGVVLMRKGAQ